MIKGAGRKRMISMRRGVSALIVAVIVPALLLSIILYRWFYKEHYETIISTNEAMLKAMSVAIEDNQKLVENVVDLLSYDKSVISLLRNKEEKYSQVVQQVFRIQELIVEREAILSQLAGDIIIFSDKEAVPSSYWYILQTSSAMEMEGYQQFLSTGKINGWVGEEMMYPESTVISNDNRQIMLSYYKLIMDSLSGRLGVIKCGVKKSRFLESVSTKDSDGKLFVMQGNKVIYGDLSDMDILDVQLNENQMRQNIDGVIYITYPIQALDMNLILALDKKTIGLQTVIYALPQLLIILGVVTIMIFMGNIIKHSIYKRIDHVVDIATSAKSNYMDVTLPESDDKDINILIDALNILIQKIRSNAQSRIEQERKEKNALRLALQYQMNPHFLFNTLNWIQMCIELGAEPEKTSEGIVILGRLLRYNLNGEAYAPISQEIERTQDYIRLMNMRKENAISLDIKLSGVDPGQPMMRFMLQPLCENAIQHGLSHGQHLHIDINISKIENEFMIIVKNDGMMIEPEVLKEIMGKIRCNQSGNGVGLTNIYARIKLFYGEVSDMLIESNREETSITLKLFEEVY